MEAFVITERRHDTVWIQLNRPQKANAYHAPMLLALQAAVRSLRDDEGARVVLFSGRGTHFCAGADLSEVRARPPVEALHLQSVSLFDEIARLPAPTIAALHGASLGGGLELALACDLRVAADDATFGFPETHLGLIPAAGGTLRLPRTVGLPQAKSLIFTARRIDAAEAARLGLVGEVVPANALMERAFALADEISRNDPLALQLAKRALHSGLEAYPAVAQALLYRQRTEGAVSRA